MSFKSLGLSENLLKAVSEKGYTDPSPIQEKAIPVILERKDVLASAQTGTGKTAAFSLPILHNLDADVQHVQAIILAPTRELCLQIGNDIASYTKFMNVKVTAVYGGAPITKQIKELQGRPQIVVGTPGRTLDLIQRKKLRIEDVQFLVLDEADEMLSMGFQDELDAILANTPEHKQTLCFSATMPDGMKHLTKKYLNDPKEISAGKRNISASNVAHELYVVGSKNTYEAMRRIVDFNPNMYGIVFCRTRRETQSIAEQLVGDGYRAEAIHGDLSQAQRDDVMSRFRRKKLNLMVATDVAARGIDVNDLTHVINVNIPDDPEVYVHRSGRTGRAGASGISLVITHGRNMRKVKSLERLIGKQFEEKTVPSGDDICGIKMKEAIDEIVSYEHTTTIDPQLLDVAMDKLAHLSKAELIERFVGHETSVMLSRYRGARDINEKASSPKEHGKRDRSTGREEGFKTVVIDLGYRQNVNPSRIMGLINDAMEGTKVRIGKIDMDKTFTKIDIEDRHAVEVAARLNGAKTGSYVVNSYFEEGSSSTRAERPSYGGRDRRDSGGYKGKRNFEGGSDRRDSRSNDRPVRRERISGERTERRERFSNDRTSSDRRSSGGFSRDDNRSGSRTGGGSSRTGARSTGGGYGKPKSGGGYPKGNSSSAGRGRRSF